MFCFFSLVSAWFVWVASNEFTIKINIHHQPQTGIKKVYIYRIYINYRYNSNFQPTDLMPGRLRGETTSLLIHKKHQGEIRSITHSLCLQGQLSRTGADDHRQAAQEVRGNQDLCCSEDDEKKTLEDERKGWFTSE